jgi:hypothetical protein
VVILRIIKSILYSETIEIIFIARAETKKLQKWIVIKSDEETQFILILFNDDNYW